jgi:hypothetical protein
MKSILIACETSGEVRRAFAAAGWNAVSCDMLPADDPANITNFSNQHHYEGDVLDILDLEWDMIIAHPPCTYLASSGLHWNKRVPGRAQKTEDALDFVWRIWSSPCPKVVIENPVGCISTRLKMPKPQYIQPYEFGHDASKKTGLWIRGVKPLCNAKYRRIPGRMVKHNGKMVERWANQTDSGQNRLPPSAGRWKARSKTYRNIAQAMADQWG